MSGGMTRVGDWMITASGGRFWALDPRPEDVDFDDIAHALAHICRYGGHANRFYSVAEHSVSMAAYFHTRGRVDLARWALLHDAAEAYCGDIVRPMKRSIVGYSEIETAVEVAIWEAAGFTESHAIPPEVHEADAAILGDEARALFGDGRLQRAGWMPPYGLGIHIEGWMPPLAAARFRDALDNLFPGLCRP